MFSSDQNYGKNMIFFSKHYAYQDCIYLTKTVKQLQYILKYYSNLFEQFYVAIYIFLL